MAQKVVDGEGIERLSLEGEGLPQTKFYENAEFPPPVESESAVPTTDE